ncbi:splicing factor, arginine/serine-rich 19-like [Esox lucius]|uniref:splicing factor, arginine/serine-rich 19-like n=1 Tax=Esox lucius TaxID=8010 RepID=UPI001476F2E8|nr:splicing factor, arginine/serine-rich 19-like [Esox lucius]
MSVAGIHRGFLRKYGGFMFKQWKQRYLILTADGCLLMSRDAVSPPDHMVALQGGCEAIVEGREILDLPKLPSGGRRDCCFALILPQEKFLLLLADNAENCSQWVNMLKKVRECVSSPVYSCRRHHALTPCITDRDPLPDPINDRDPPTPPLSDMEVLSPTPNSPTPNSPGPNSPGSNSPGPNYPGPNCSGPKSPGPIYPGTNSPGPNYPGPTYPGPNSPGPNYHGPTYPGPNSPGPNYPGPAYPGPNSPGPNYSEATIDDTPQKDKGNKSSRMKRNKGSSRSVGCLRHGNSHDVRAVRAVYLLTGGTAASSAMGYLGACPPVSADVRPCDLPPTTDYSDLGPAGTYHSCNQNVDSPHFHSFDFEGADSDFEAFDCGGFSF